MAYKLEHSSDEQRKLLSSTLQKLGNCQPDVYLVSSEGHKVYTQRVLLGLNSSLMDELLTRTAGVDHGNLPGISIPATSGCLVNLLKILSTGVAIADNKSHLLEAAYAAECIGIKLENCQIGVKKKKKEESCEQVDDAGQSNKKKRKVTVVPKKTNRINDDRYDTIVKQETNYDDEIDANKEGQDDTQSKLGLEKRHHCEHCDKAFTTKQAMQRHAMIHTDNPTPWGCNHCEKRYDRKYRLDKHMKTAHADISVEVTPEVASYCVENDNQRMDIHNDVEKPPMPDNSELPTSSIETIEKIASMYDDNELPASSIEPPMADECDFPASSMETEEMVAQQDVVVGSEKEQFKEEQGPSIALVSSNIPDPVMKEKLLADRQKLLEELNSFEDQQEVLDVLN